MYNIGALYFLRGSQVLFPLGNAPMLAYSLEFLASNDVQQVRSRDKPPPSCQRVNQGGGKQGLTLERGR